jgi:acyl carrier protein
MITAPARHEIETYLVGLLKQLMRDWDSEREITASTRLFGELGFESLDAVVLGTAIQDHYGQAMPFSQLLAEIGERGRDLSVDELVAFVQTHATAPRDSQ